MGCCTSSVERKIQKSTGEGIHRRGLASLLYLGSFKTRSEICKNENAELRKIRAIHRHSGGMIISPRLMNYVMVLLRWKRFICHVGRARDQYSFAEAGLVARGKERQEERQTIFFTPLDPFNSDADEAESVSDTSKPREVKYQTHWRPEQDAVYWIHLSTARGAGLEFLADRFQCYYYVPVCAKRMRRKGCQRKWKERIVRQSTYTSQRTKVTLRASWVHARSNNLREPRETESFFLQTWKLLPNTIRESQLAERGIRTICWS